MTTVNESIADDETDDGHHNYSGNWSTSYNGDSHLLYNYSTGVHPGYRFTTVAVDPAATINEATLTVVTNGGGSVTSTLYGNYDNDANEFGNSGGQTKPRDMTPTSASVTFALTSTGSLPFDVTDIVQEIVDRESPAWASGNAMAFACQGTITGTRKYIYDLVGGSNEATLDITWGEGGGGGGANTLALLGVG